MTSQNDNLTKSCSIGTNFVWLVGLVWVFRDLLEKNRLQLIMELFPFVIES